MDNHIEKNVRPFGLRDKLGYMFGDFGNDFTFIFASSFLMVFYTKVLGIEPGAVGVLFLVARCVDAFTDVGMGRLVDRMRPGKDGRFKSWVRWIAGPVAISSFLMYQSGLAGAPMALKMVYMYVTYLLWGSVFYTAINIPYGSMASAISEDPGDRSSLSVFRTVGATLASLIIGVGGPLLVYSTDAAGNQVVVGSRMTVIAGVFSVCAIICYILFYKMTTERVKTEPRPDANRVTLGQTFSAIFRNRALLAIIGAAIGLLLSQLMSQSMNNYLFQDYFKNTNSLSVINFISTGVTLLIATFVTPLTRRIGKKEAAAAAMILAGASYILLFFMRVTNPYVYIAVSVGGYIGIGVFNLVIWANITDVIDYQEVMTRQRDDGTVYAVYSFARKIGQALAGGLSGFALGAIGYDSLAHAQTEAVNNGIYSVTTLVPGICFLAVAVILIFAYPLSKRKVEENTEILQKRRETEAE